MMSMDKLCISSHTHCVGHAVPPGPPELQAMDFLDEKNSCGQTILKLVSRGNAIIAELLRLSDFVPPIVKLETKADHDRYALILPDFAYFRRADEWESKIDSSTVR